MLIQACISYTNKHPYNLLRIYPLPSPHISVGEQDDIPPLETFGRPLSVYSYKLVLEPAWGPDYTLFLEWYDKRLVVSFGIFEWVLLRSSALVFV